MVLNQQARGHGETRPQAPCLGCRRLAFKLDGAAGDVHLIVDQLSVPSPSCFLPIGADRRVTCSGPDFSASLIAGKSLLGRGEDHRDRLQLRNRQNAALVVGVHDVAGIDQPEAGATA